MRSVRFPIAFALIALSAPDALQGQGVLVAPHGIFIDHRTRSGSLELYNPHPQAAEVSISMVFGYPVTDSVGNLTLRTTETPHSGQPSAASWLEAYPRRLILRPLERQRVRFFARPPADLPDGEYWTRVIVAAKGGRPTEVSKPDTSEIQIGLTMEMRTIVAAFYRKGAVRTAIGLSNLRAEIVGDSLAVRGRLVRHGNAAFIGTVRGRLVDAGGRQLASFSNQVGVYYAVEPRFMTPVRGIPPGRYVLHLDVTTDRDDLGPNVVLKATPVRDSAVVVVPRGAP
jgi:hypothetical protein